MSSVNSPFDPNDSSRSSPHRQPAAAILPCEDVADLIPAYSIGATDPEEVAVVNGRLAACAHAAAELAEYGKMAEALLYTAPRQQAPSRLAARLRAASDMPRLTPHQATAAPSTPAPRPSTAKRRKPSPFTLVPLPTPQPRRPWSFGRTVAVAATLLLVALNVTLLVQNHQLRVHQQQLMAALDQQNKALIFLAAEEPQEVVLPAAQENSEAQADVLWNNDLGVAVIYVRAFPPLPSDMAYQLWLRKGEQRTSAGLFTVDDHGMGIMVFPIEESLNDYDLMGITPEPAGGSPGPTAPAVVRGPV